MSFMADNTSSFLWSIPGKTRNLLLVLTAAIFGLAYLKFTASPAITSYQACVESPGSRLQASNPPQCITQNGQTFTALNLSPTPAPSHQPTLPPLLLASPSASLSTPTATPSSVVINPQTGLARYTNYQYGFSFEYPKDWKQTEFNQKNQPIVLIGVGDNQDVAALTFTLSDWNFDSTLFDTASPSAFSYAGWTGSQASTKDGSVSLTLAGLTQTSPSGQGFRATWVRSLDKGNPYTIDAALKPILKSFKFLP